MLEEYEAVAQQVVNELYRDNQIPFRLFPGIVICLAPDDYTIRFFDSRLYSLDVTCHEEESFKEVFRAAVLERVDRMTGTLNKKASGRRT
jgi:hypothetical protein